jgi:toxin ParE1/3/4
MSSDEKRPFSLTPRALDDLENIWRYTAETWSVGQADRYIDDLTGMFETIAILPMLARERREFDPPVRIHAHESHLIVYLLADNHVAILRLLGGREGWVSVLKSADL